MSKKVPAKVRVVAPLIAALAMLLAASTAQAQTQTTPATAAPAQSSPVKKELAAKILLLQQASVEGIATVLAQQPAAQLMQAASVALQTRVAPDKRDAVAKEIQADVKKYVDEAVPLLRERAVKIAPSTIGAVLEEKFTEDELKQLIAIMESPVNRKYGQMSNELQKVLGEKLVAETRGVIEPKVRALDESIVKRMAAAESAPATDLAPAAKSSAPKSTRPAKPAGK